MINSKLDHDGIFFNGFGKRKLSIFFLVAHLTVCCWKVYLICISRLLTSKPLSFTRKGSFAKHQVIFDVMTVITHQIRLIYLQHLFQSVIKFAFLR